MSIRFLDPVLINQIAAGEVVERPASVIKELIENSLDAGATSLRITLREGGKAYLSVKDNGSGMGPHDLGLCVERHATSKIPDNDLFKIESFGFRGEALAAISSVARVTITTRQKDEEMAWQLTVSGGEKSSLIPVHSLPGTHIEIRDLFYATPARLKFLKSNQSELSSCFDIVEKFALSHLGVAFYVTHNERTLLTMEAFDTLEERLTQVISADFIENAIPLKCHDEDRSVAIHGYTSLTTYNASRGGKQYFFVNNRPVKDKMLQTALKVAYHDYVPKDRYPVCCLFLTVDPARVDMNVHPAKTEVRFMQSGKLRDFLIDAIHQHLGRQGAITSSHLSKGMVDAFTVTPVPSYRSLSSSPFIAHRGEVNTSHLTELENFLPLANTVSVQQEYQPAPPDAPFIDESFSSCYPLGQAQAQLFNSYIISQTVDSFYLVDQHAAAERLLYEKLKKQVFSSEIERQLLLIPEIINVKENELALFHQCHEELKQLGFGVDSFGVGQLIVREIPALLKDCPLRQILLDVIEDIKEYDSLSPRIQEKILEKLATRACHGSIRFGRKLSIVEMNALLRDIETTAFSYQCNHGRPSFIRLARKDLERLFERA